MIKFKRISKILLSAVLIVAMLFPTTQVLGAAGSDTVPYDSFYYWNDNGRKIAMLSKAVFEPSHSISGKDLGIGEFLEIQHTAVYDNKLYIMDSGNGRIVVVDSNYDFIEQITEFDYNGEKLTFTGAKGIYVDDSGMYVCDTASKRLIWVRDGQVQRVITRPDDPAIPETFDYAPSRLVRDSSGYYYLLCDASYYGLMVFTDEFEFVGFFGSNQVKTTLSSAIKEAIKSLFDTETKHSTSIQALPYAIKDICIDSEGFLMSLNTEYKGQIKRYGLTGSNTMKVKNGFVVSNTDGYNFADEPVVYQNNENKYREWVSSAIVSIYADSDGFFYGVETKHGRVFMYDTAANVLSVFGGGFSAGNQLGTFVTPSSICALNGDLLISDFTTGKITVFKLTEYGKLLKTADSLSLKNKYTEAKPYWTQINNYDKNNQLAYVGLAKAALKEENYKLAMEYAELADSKAIYAEAYEVVRNDFLKDNFIWIFLVAVAAISALAYFFVRSKREKLVLVKNERLRTALNTIVHPIQTYSDIKQRNMGSPIIATVFMALFYVSSIVSQLNSNFMANNVQRSNFSSVLILLGTVGIVMLWTVSNWLVCILFSGKGTMKEIYCASCYSLAPMIIYYLCFTALSYVIIPSSNSVLALFQTIAYLVTAILLLLSISIIHEFSFFKSIGIALAVILAMVIVAFVLFVILTLWQDLITFVLQIIDEFASM